jgi:hypothetical protein
MDFDKAREMFEQAKREVEIKIRVAFSDQSPANLLINALHAIYASERMLGRTEAMKEFREESEKLEAARKAEWDHICE